MAKLVKVSCVQYGDYYFNRDLITFISSGELGEFEGQPTQQIFVHFSGGKESAMLFVTDKSEVIARINEG